MFIIPGGAGNPGGGNPPIMPGGGAIPGIIPPPPGGGGPPGSPPIPLIGPANPAIGGAPGGGIPPIGPPGPPMPIIGSPRPAGLAIPGPVAATPAVEGAPGAFEDPRRAEGSAGGGPSTERDTIVTPRKIMRPRVRFSSEIVAVAAGALQRGGTLASKPTEQGSRKDGARFGWLLFDAAEFLRVC